MKHFRRCIENCKCKQYFQFYIGDILKQDIDCKCVNECKDENPYAYGRHSIHYK